MGCASRLAPPAASPAPAQTLRVTPQIVTPREATSERELLERGQNAILWQRWREAADAFETLLAAARVPGGTMSEAERSLVLFDLGLSYEGLGEREKARDRYHELAERYPTSAEARAALVRAAEVHAYLEEWTSLGQTAETLLARNDLDSVDRLTALGARGLARVEAGDDTSAMHDVLLGLDLVDELHYGAENRLPVGAAQLRFALAEIRRVRSERIAFVPVTPDFLVKIEIRCQGLLDAQNAYADAIRSVDPHWAEMSGYRIGEMYRTLHRDLMLIPPTEAAKSAAQKDLFFAMMHLRYRVLLEKGLDMMQRTLALADKMNDSSSWVRRAREAQAEMELALMDEKATLARFPYSEETVQKALGILQKKAEAKKAGEARRSVSTK